MCVNLQRISNKVFKAAKMTSKTLKRKFLTVLILAVSFIGFAKEPATEGEEGAEKFDPKEMILDRLVVNASGKAFVELACIVGPSVAQNKYSR